MLIYYYSSIIFKSSSNWRPNPTLPNSNPPLLLKMTTKPKPKSRTKSNPKPQNPQPKSTTILQDIEDFSPQETLTIRSSLLHWYHQNHRTLPWRSEAPTPQDQESQETRAYAVWVSEIMLQQTRVNAAIAYYNKWMEKWPTVNHLAAASLDEVNEMWAGLGYYRRARFLLEGAKAIVEGAEFPRTAAELRGVRGIGEYTSRAIASIAFNEAVPVVDGNVVRVITRLKAISANPKETATMKSIWKLAGQLVDPSKPGDFNQAMMELGATLCSVTSPNCSSCPVSDQCQAYSRSLKSKIIKVTDYPTKVVKAKQKNDFAAVCVVEIAQDLDKVGYLLVKRPEEGLLAGLWEFPSVLMEEGKTDICTRRRTMDKYLKKLFDLEVGKNCNVTIREEAGDYLHVFSHIRLHMHVELLVLSLKDGLKLLENVDHSAVIWKCVDGNSIKSMGLTSNVRKVYNMIQDFKETQLPQQPKVAKRKRTKRTI